MQENLIKTLEDGIFRFKTKHQITFTNRPHETNWIETDQFFEKMYKGIGPASILGAQAYFNSEGIMTYVLYSLTALILILTIYNIKLAQRDNVRDTNNYRNNVITSEHMDTYNTIHMNSSLLFTSADVKYQNKLQVNVSTLHDLIQTLDEELSIIKSRTKELSNYLKETRSIGKEFKFDEQDVKTLEAKGKKDVAEYGNKFINFFIKNSINKNKKETTHGIKEGKTEIQPRHIGKK